MERMEHWPFGESHCEIVVEGTGKFCWSDLKRRLYLFERKVGRVTSCIWFDERFFLYFVRQEGLSSSQIALIG